MLLNAVPDLALVALLIGWVAATLTRNYRDAWLTAFLLMLLHLIRGVVDPAPTIWERALHATVVAVWLWVTIKEWHRSGLPCHRHGHVWMVTATTPGGATVQMGANNPAAEQQLLTWFVPPDAHITYSCAVCGKAR